jgi:hypothetical protein
MDDVLTIDLFMPTAEISNGNAGLATTPNSVSTATITGSGLGNGQRVVVKYFKNDVLTYKWTGRTMQANTGKTQCTVLLRQEIGGNGRPTAPPPGEDPSTVNVTVGTQHTTANVYLGAIMLLAGQCVIRCCGTAGTNVWLDADGGGSAGVYLADENDIPNQWTLGAVANTTGGYYTIKNNALGKYLCWAADSPTVLLVEGTQAGTTWQIMVQADGSSLALTQQDTPRYLYGNTEEQDVALIDEPTADGGTSWLISAQGKRA